MPEGPRSSRQPRAARIALPSLRPYVEAVEAFIAELDDDAALIIDVRPNSSGDELLARRVARWFVDGTKTYAKHRSRTGKGGCAFRRVHPPADVEQELVESIAIGADRTSRPTSACTQ